MLVSMHNPGRAENTLMSEISTDMLKRILIDTQAQIITKPSPGLFELTLKKLQGLRDNVSEGMHAHAPLARS